MENREAKETEKKELNPGELDKASGGFEPGIPNLPGHSGDPVLQTDENSSRIPRTPAIVPRMPP